MIDIVNYPEWITLFLTSISPFITSVFLKTNMSSRTKNWVAFAISGAIALVYVFMSGGFGTITGPEDLVVPLGFAYGYSQFLYNTFFKKAATYIEANYGLKEIKLDAGDEKQEVVKATTVDGSEVVVAVPESQAEVLTEPKG